MTYFLLFQMIQLNRVRTRIAKVCTKFAENVEFVE